MNKKITPYLFGIAAAGVTVLLAGTVSVCLLPEGDHAPVVLVSDPAAADMMAQAVLNAKCADCHGENPTYNGFVNLLAFGQLRRDVENAQKAFTLAGNPGVRSGAVDYLKMDKVLRTRNMPPTQYTMVHLGTGLTPADVAILRTRYTKDGALARMFSPINNGAKPMEGCCSAPRTPILNAMREGSLMLGENPLKIRLGHLLFYDGRLSTNNKISCSSCHNLTLGGTDNKPKSEGVPKPRPESMAGAVDAVIGGGEEEAPQLGGVNAPSVYNAAGNIRQFWDGRAADLAEQAGGPPLNPVEMGYEGPEDWAKIAAKLAEDPELVDLFRAVYGDAGITGETITDAIAAFEKCLSTPDSAFDAYLKGDSDALDDMQKDGLQDFIDYGCVTCHAGPTLGGMSFENINTHAELREHAGDYEEGAFGLADFTKNAGHKDMFRVPNLRNVALTAPYFHTGTAETLEDAVRIMFRTEVGTEPSNAMVNRVTAFLHAQTGKLGGKPLDMLTPEDVSPVPAPGSARMGRGPAPAPAAVPAVRIIVQPAPAIQEKPAITEPVQEVFPVQKREDDCACGKECSGPAPCGCGCLDKSEAPEVEAPHEVEIHPEEESVSEAGGTPEAKDTCCTAPDTCGCTDGKECTCPNLPKAE